MVVRAFRNIFLILVLMVGCQACETECPKDGCGEGNVCEEGSCFADRMSECGPDAECASWLDCKDGPTGSVCVTPCTSNDQCAMMERCYLKALGPLAEFKDHCFVNLCKPSNLDPLGIFQKAEYLGPCNVNGEGDGLCMGPISNDGIGFCVLQGTIPAGDSCDANALQGDGSGARCNDGMCIPDQNICAPMCKLFSADHACPEPFACAPVFVTRMAASGFCFDVGASAPGLRESCVSGETPITCQDGMVCTPATLDEGAPTICRSFCDTEASQWDEGRCMGEGEVCISVDANNPDAEGELSKLGVCVIASSDG